MNSFTSLTEFQSRSNKREPSVMCVDCMMHTPWETYTYGAEGQKVMAKCELLYPGQTYGRRLYGSNSISVGLIVTPEDGCDMGKKEAVL